MRLHTPSQQLHEAKNIALCHGMDVSETKTAKGETVYKLYRKIGGHRVCLGQRKSTAGIRSLVCLRADFR